MQEKKQTNLMILPAAFFVVVCIVAYFAIKMNTHEWGYKYTDLIEKSPNQAEWYYFRACTRESTINMQGDSAGWAEDNMTQEKTEKRAKMILDDFSKVIELAPEFGPAYYHRARCKALNGLGDAGADLEKACELVPNDALAQRTYAEYLSNHGQPEKAAAHQKISEALWVQ
jgi:hypothetical protein